MYYVVISVNPYDAMGLQSKILQFEKTEEAITYYKECFSDRDKVIAELVELYWTEDIEKAREDGDLLVSGQTCLISCDIDISNVSGVEYEDGPLEFNSWINDYDCLTYNNVCISALDVFELVGATEICSYSFDIPVPSFNEESYNTLRVECEKSIAAIENNYRDQEPILITGIKHVKEYGAQPIAKKIHIDNMSLLRYVFENGGAQMLRDVLSKDCVYETETMGICFYGVDEIIKRLTYLDYHHRYFAYSAKIVGTVEDDMDYPIGTKCIVLAADKEDHFESIVFMSTDIDGHISRIIVSTDTRYQFYLDHKDGIFYLDHKDGI